MPFALGAGERKSQDRTMYHTSHGRQRLFGRPVPRLVLLVLRWQRLRGGGSAGAREPAALPCGSA